MTSINSARRLAWALGLGSAALCVFMAGFSVALGLTVQLLTLALGYLFGVLMGVGRTTHGNKLRSGIAWAR